MLCRIKIFCLFWALLFMAARVLALYTPVCGSCSPVEMTVTSSGLKCKCGQEYTPNQVLAAVEQGLSDVQLSPPNNDAALHSASESQGAGLYATLVTFYQTIRSGVSSFFRFTHPLVRFMDQEQTEELRTMGSGAQSLAHTVVALDPNNLWQIYQSTFGSHISGTLQATASFLNLSAQMAMSHYLQLEPTLSSAELTAEAKVDQAIRLWLLVKLWMLILHHKSMAVEGVQLLHIQAQGQNYGDVNLQSLFEMAMGVIAVPGDLSRWRIGVASWIESNVFGENPMKLMEARHFVINDRYHFFIVAPKEPGAPYHLITPNGNVIPLVGEMPFREAVEQALRSLIQSNSASLQSEASGTSVWRGH